MKEMAAEYLATAENVSADCQMNQATIAVKNSVHFIVYYAVLPCLSLLGIFGHTACLIAVRGQVKGQSYFCQLAVTLNELLLVVAMLIYDVALECLSGFRHPGPTWFTGNYVLMWISGYAAVPLANCFITGTILSTVYMVLDRSLALSKPFCYKDINHRRLRTWVTVLCATLAVFTSAVDALRYAVVPLGDIYIIVSSEFKSSLAANILSYFRNAIYVLALVVMVVCNYLMIRVLKRRAARSKSLRSGAETGMKPEEKTLLIFTICQSSVITVGTLCMIGFFALVYGVPVFIGCTGQIVLPIVDVLTLLTGSADFYLLIIVSRRFRNMVCSTVFGINRITDSVGTVNLKVSARHDPTR